MRVLIGYDGSVFAEAALDDLHHAGLPPNVEAVMLCVADAWLAPGVQATDARVSQNVAELVEEARQLAESGVTRLRAEFPSWNITAETVIDSPAWALIKRAEGIDRPWRADLTVVGAAGRSAAGRLVFGSVAHQVVVYSRRSVRVARLTPGRCATEAPRVVIGVDGSEDADHAVRTVAARTWAPGTQCRVVTATDNATRATFQTSPVSTLSDHAAQHAEALKEAGIEVTFHCRPGTPYRVLIQEAEQFRADCIYVGARGLGRMDRLLLGSVSSSVAMRATCSVEIVRPPQ